MSPVNGSVAPVCPISRSQAVPGMPGTLLPYVPKALDLPSAIAAANAVNQVLQLLAGQGPPTNNLYAPSLSPLNNTPGQKGVVGLKKKNQRWEERDRQTIKIKFFAIDSKGRKDKNNWLLVERITYIKWYDHVQRIDFVVEWPFDPGLERNGELQGAPPSKVQAPS